MQHTFQLLDYVYLWGDNEKELFQIVSLTRYPERTTEASYQLWSIAKNCIVRNKANDGMFNKENLLPVPISAIKKHFEHGLESYEWIPIEYYAEDDIKWHYNSGERTDEEIESEASETIATFPNNFKFNEYEINPDEEEVLEFRVVQDGIDTPHYLHQLQQYYRLMYGKELVEYYKK